jgi:acetylornithine deacetylase
MAAQENGSSTLQCRHWLRRWIAFDSTSDRSNDAINEDIAGVLTTLGFEVAWDRFVDAAGVPKSNLIARRGPRSSTSKPGLAYFCHTDVVPTGQWTGPGGNPFAPVSQEGRIYGRGACDMKGSLAAIVAAASSIEESENTAPLWIVCTADEEIGFEGAKHMVAHSPHYREIATQNPISIIGEPTEMKVVHAHKGIHVYKMTSLGRAAHSSTDDGVNANDAMISVLVKLQKIGKRTRSDRTLQNSNFDPPHLSWNYGVSDFMTVNNITPERCVAWLSCRSMPGVDHEQLIDEVRKSAEQSGVGFEFLHGGSSVWIDPKSNHIRDLVNLVGSPAETVCYGTDGGEFKELRQRVVLGPGSIEQAHTSDEWISIDQLERGIEVYRQMILNYCHE